MLLSRRNFLRGFAAALAVPFISEAIGKPYLENWREYVHFKEMPTGVTGLMFALNSRYVDEGMQFTIDKYSVVTHMSERETGEQLHHLFSSFTRKVLKDINQWQMRSNQNVIAKDTRRGIGNTTVPLNGDYRLDEHGIQIREHAAVIYHNRILGTVQDGPIGVLRSAETGEYGIVLHRDFDKYGFNLV